MRYQVRIGEQAERDLESIYDYIVASDGAAQAQQVLDALIQVAESLTGMPERGNCPRELGGSGFTQYRQVIRAPWRIIYHVVGKQVFIDVVADGRRDLRSLLAQRLLDA
ncbi:type II toxin-antitoxin system RelE/ParE family toxin [Dyella caseinilytica]|uniref:Type II toxin-antitoxin system RelE/ParE family toxin n=1 Tax=Dyella caseinilytica TaxID=1849581 RepID=A0ABX7GW17_9GAMM|nr:type II toxin-antitoxin system RelE/ParE family toxin [Dyella caseinilytica]QRN54667.1 type II toxin-antitoxin system RelE/ParE family toxin [Dyella caseinilytica]GFZ95920.1 plasmid stabilization protein [Dyella caseinilytica]